MKKENFDYVEFKTPNDKITGSYQAWNEGKEKRTKLAWVNSITGYGGYIYDIDYQTAKQLIEAFGMFETMMFHGDEFDIDEMLEETIKDLLNRLDSLNFLLDKVNAQWKKNNILQQIKEKLKI